MSGGQVVVALEHLAVTAVGATSVGAAQYRQAGTVLLHAQGRNEVGGIRRDDLPFF